ncbi:GNAT family N-acetyltransferase [Paenibacillus sp. PK3_47]|uniref:GNAT family N-acetyltransferase n=1 Tax=Paenibacillus sp. PK3_47 TaxID=2072642 RepID=UPI00201E0B17|nr:GNAT family N-acetyltransferase [Paenibacillus sp. PK3_47]UQZ32861.1 GNAT family N-acetyltransferase [Paenibacillus sp. PK3_47]
MMNMELITTAHWDDSLWASIEPVYREAFPSGAKPERILRSMLDREIAYLHAGLSDGQVTAMAVTGIVPEGNNKRLIIDYLAVSEEMRGKGAGTSFLELIIDWAVKDHGVQGVIIEAESGDSETHNRRIHFWEKNGFILTPYVHQYIWVPEPYQAMLKPLDQHITVQDNGESLFRYINKFHSIAYRPSAKKK